MQLVTDAQILVGDLIREHDVAISLAVLIGCGAVAAVHALKPKLDFGSIKGLRGELTPPLAPLADGEAWFGPRWQRRTRYHRQAYEPISPFVTVLAEEEENGFKPLVQFGRKRGPLLKLPTALRRAA